MSAVGCRRAIVAAAVLSVAAAAAVGASGIAGAEPDTGSSAVLPIPEGYRDAVIAAGHTCAQVTPAVVAAVLSVETGFRSDLTSPTGAVGPGQLPPATVAKYARPGEDVTDPQAGTHITARVLCDIAAAVDKLAPDASGEGKRAYMLIAYNAGPEFASRLRDGVALAG